MPNVSVIIPTYNRASFLPNAITSILHQTYEDYEVIVIDDGSTDETPRVLKQFEGKIKVLFQKNRGASAARNLGIQEADGNYISFLDSDDQWTRKKLQIQMQRIQEDPDIKICYTDEIWIRNGVRVNQKKRHRKYDGWFIDKMLPLCLISPSSVLIHREIFDTVGMFDEGLPVCEDYDLWLRINVRYPITFIPEPLIIKFGGHEDQLSRQYGAIDRFRVQALEKLLDNPYLKEVYRPLVIQTIRQKCRILANGCFKRGKIEQGKVFQAMIQKYQLC